MIENIEELYKKVNIGNQEEKLAIIKANLEQVKNGPYRLSQRASYFDGSHTPPDEMIFEEYRQAKARKIAGISKFSREKWICKLAVGQFFDAIGEIIDYQVPLKTPRGKDNSGLGEIDLLALNGNTLYLLEVKEPKNTETPLKAILEIHTYWKQLGGDKCQLFSGHSKVCGAQKVKKALLLFEEEAESSVYRQLFHRDGHEHLLALMKELDVECFVGALKDGEKLVGVRPKAL